MAKGAAAAGLALLLLLSLPVDRLTATNAAEPFGRGDGDGGSSLLLRLFPLSKIDEILADSSWFTHSLKAHLSSPFPPLFSLLGEEERWCGNKGSGGRKFEGEAGGGEEETDRKWGKTTRGQ